MLPSPDGQARRELRVQQKQHLAASAAAERRARLRPMASQSPQSRALTEAVAAEAAAQLHAAVVELEAGGEEHRGGSRGRDAAAYRRIPRRARAP